MLKQIETIRGYGFFLEADYARSYLGSSHFWRLAVPHYVLLGEQMGLRPHPLFDPVCFRRNAGPAVDRKECALIAFIERFAGKTISPSVEFEQEWYAWQNGEWSQAFSHPFLHCVRFGLLRGCDPAPSLDLRKLSQVWGVAGAGLVSRLYSEIQSHGRVPVTYATYTPQELRVEQEAFRARIKLARLLDRRKTKRRFLVFVQAGQCFDRPFVNDVREFDVLLNYYDGCPDNIPPGVDVAVSQRGTKTTAISKILNEERELLLHYDAVLFLDDDIDLGARDIERVFSTMRDQGLDLAQASLSSDSDCIWPVFKQPNVGSGVRRVNSVEIMMPCLSQRALENVGWAFSESVSGFGVDLLFGHSIARQEELRAGVIGSVVARHEKKINEQTGEFYNFLRRSNINPKLELWYIMKRYGIEARFEYI